MDEIARLREELAVMETSRNETGKQRDSAVFLLMMLARRCQVEGVGAGWAPLEQAWEFLNIPVEART